MMNIRLIFNKVPINYLSANEFMGEISGWLRGRKKRKVYYLNVHNLITAFKNSDYLDVLRKANLIYADGFGPVLVLKFINNIKTERVNAADFVDRFLYSISKNLEPKVGGFKVGGSKEKRIRIFLLGSEEDVINKTAKEIQRKYKKIILVGYHHGFFDSSCDSSVISAIKKGRPNLVLVGMGSPKQEMWVDRNYSKLPPAVYWSVGGLFYLMSGKRSRAPIFMRNHSLEWLYRLIQEPKRLFSRYTLENLYFILLFIKFYLIKIFQER
jgi:N-acetylglucosaminyldiphosphoundecaprenol N-acetyl-beta-D-mannosaminyltransferase